MKSKRKVMNMTLVTMLLAISVFIHMIEPAVPLGIPGVKFGLANTIGLITLELFDAKTMLRVNLMRVLISTLLRGIIFGIGFWLSLFGVILSSLAVILFSKTTKLSPIGLSVASATFHNIGQILALILINKIWAMIYYLPFLLITGIPTGILTGYIVMLVLSRLKKTGLVIRLKGNTSQA
ncbi:MAG: Gx transporter family protein [Erysipelothrix sp.]|jgi:heptaprenyl diphosphate synthase|nr:Gx transporter family protein [Erysipelothrix sp.]